VFPLGPKMVPAASQVRGMGFGLRDASPLSRFLRRCFTQHLLFYALLVPFFANGTAHAEFCLSLDVSAGMAPASLPSESKGKPDSTLLEFVLINPQVAHSGGASAAPSASDGSGPQNTGQPPRLAYRPPTDAPALVGVLFLEAILRRPPPFPSRLFRPPRPFQMHVS
jgi:hypothetical protein